MTKRLSPYRFDTIVIGGGQSGLALGYYLAQQGRDFVILDAGTRVGDAWRRRWDSLRLFTPAAYSSLPGLPFPAPGTSFPTKDAMADYLEGYAQAFDLPVRCGQRVATLRSADDGYRVTTGDAEYTADHVIVATGPYHAPRIPIFAPHLNPAIMQLHSSVYRTPDQLPTGAVLVVGAGNSGAEIALELAATRPTTLSGRDTGHVPAGLARHRLFWWLLDRIPVDPTTRLGQQVLNYHRRRGDPLFRLTPSHLRAAGIVRVPRTTGVVGGKPQLANGRVLDVASVVWATGFRPDFGWIELPVFDTDGYPIQHQGVVTAARGLYFLGLPFQRTLTSAVIGGVGKDARYLSQHMLATGPARPMPGPPRSSAH
jgi:putative flavoprotein involved in K+ transport